MQQLFLDSNLSCNFFSSILKRYNVVHSLNCLNTKSNIGRSNVIVIQLVSILPSLEKLKNRTKGEKAFDRNESVINRISIMSARPGSTTTDIRLVRYDQCTAD